MAYDARGNSNTLLYAKCSIGFTLTVDFQPPFMDYDVMLHNRYVHGGNVGEARLRILQVPWLWFYKSRSVYVLTGKYAVNDTHAYTMEQISGSTKLFLLCFKVFETFIQYIFDIY